MRIISKFSDYYDSGLAYGQDPNLVYERVTRTEPFTSTGRGSNSWESRQEREIISGVSTYDVDELPGGWQPDRNGTGFLYFCGVRFPYAWLTLVRQVRTPVGDTVRQDHTIYFWSQEAVNSWVDQHRTRTRRQGRRDRWRGFLDSERSWEPVVDHTANLRFNSPIVQLNFGSYGDAFTVNPELKPLGFAQVIDAYHAFQEISMYMAGPLSGWEDPDLNPEPTGAEKMANKGMDPVKGFRRRVEKS